MKKPDFGRTALALTAGLLMTGCAQIAADIPLTRAGYDLPVMDVTASEIDPIFACIKDTGALEGQGFAVGPFSNDTGKSNASGDGATGSFLPNGPNLSIYAIEAVSRAGAVAFDYSNLEVVKNISLVGGSKAIEQMHAMQNANMPNYAITVFATALDFGAVQRADVRVGGVGPTYTQSNARSYYAAHIVQPGSQISLARGFAMYQADYLEGGLGSSRFFGGGSGTLVTGNVSFASQEPLQRPTAEGVMLAVAFALLEIPALSGCKSAATEFLLNAQQDPDAVEPAQTSVADAG